MICKDSVEEKIVDLQIGKQQVSESIIQIDKTVKTFDKTKVEDLFS